MFIVQSVQWLATGWTVWESNPGAGEIFHTGPDWLWDPPSLLYNGYQVSFLWIRQLWRGVDQPPHSSTEVKERLELYLYCPSEPLWPLLGWNLPLPLPPTSLMLMKLSFTFIDWVSSKIENKHLPPYILNIFPYCSFFYYSTVQSLCYCAYVWPL